MTTWQLFSLSTDLLDREIQVIESLKVETTLSRFLRNLLSTVPASNKLSSIEVVSKLGDREPKSEGWSKEGLEKVIYIYPTNPALQCFDKVEIVQTKFLQDIQDKSEHFGETI